MDKITVGPIVEIGRIVFRSWEHRWKTDQVEAQSIASAARVLPDVLTEPIYEILKRWEHSLLRSSLPFSPYGLRIRSANGWLAFEGSEHHLVETVRQSCRIGEICPNWDEALRRRRLLLVKGPRERHDKYGAVVRVPSSDAPISSAYEVRWQPVSHHPVNVDSLLRQFSPRYKEPMMFGHRGA